MAHKHHRLVTHCVTLMNLPRLVPSARGMMIKAVACPRPLRAPDLVHFRVASSTTMSENMTASCVINAITSHLQPISERASFGSAGQA